jgi:hypothetical protein
MVNENLAAIVSPRLKGTKRAGPSPPFSIESSAARPYRV